jgi:hypothetical protein
MEAKHELPRPQTAERPAAPAAPAEASSARQFGHRAARGGHTGGRSSRSRRNGLRQDRRIEPARGAAASHHEHGEGVVWAMSDNGILVDRIIHLHCSSVETNHGPAIELIIAGFDPVNLNDIAMELRAVLRENNKRIFRQIERRLQCSSVDTKYGRGIELIVVGVDTAKLNDIAMELRTVLRENNKRIFGESAQLAS